MKGLKELAREAALETGYTITDTEEIVRAFLDKVMESVRDGEEVNLSKFGIFMRVLRPAKTMTNPQNGEKMTVKAHWATKYKESSVMRRELNK